VNRIGFRKMWSRASSRITKEKEKENGKELKKNKKIMYKKRKSEKTKTRKEEGEMNEKLKQVQKCFFFL
jgi:uncharacterized FlaG/YvyC family protein